ncbi:MAG TPA: CehA/McbA family metallohydrolase [Polyangiaceae bacterium]|nr:CehA/McbA family metallohydrolase [Polyangiaceae bacterium]
MRSSRAKAASTAGALLLLAAGVQGLRLRVEAQVLLRAGGVVLERVDETVVPQGDRLDADEGDLMLSDGALQVVVGASAEATDRRFEFGTILDVTGPGFSDDALGAMHAAAMISGRKVRVVTDRVEAGTERNVPVIRIREHDASSMLGLVSTVRLVPKKSRVEIVTVAENRSSRTLPVRLGDELEWPGEPTFLPGYGDVEQSGKRAVAWVARRGPLSYGLVFPAAPAEVEFVADQSDTAQTAWATAVTLAPGQKTSYRRVLVATPEGVSEVARVAAEITGTAVGRVSGLLSPAPAWAILTAIASDGTIALKESAREDGRFSLFLPPGRYTLLLQTSGGFDQAEVTVRGGAETIARLVTPQAERLDFRVTDEGGALIPARIVVTGTVGTPDPRFLSMPRVSAAGNEVHTVTGEGHVEIPPGRYKVIVSRGIEWSIEERNIEVKPEQGVALRIALSHEIPTPGWISADLHLHAKPSGDSELPLDDRIASLVAAGVEFAVATDHNHVTDYGPTIDSLSAHRLLSSTRGVEITTRTWGHFNAYPLPPKSPAPPHVGDPPEMFAAVHKLAPDALIQVNHPWMPGWGYFHRAVLNERTGARWRKQFSFDFDAIEVANGYELGKVDIVGRNLRRYFDLLNLGRRYTAVGNSDSHKLTNEWAGYPRTYVRVADDHPGRASAEEIAKSIRDGHATVSLGPIVEARIGVAGPGDTVHTTPGTLPLDITVRAPQWVSVDRVDVVVSGDTVDSFDVGAADRESGGVRFSRTVDLVAEHDAFVVVVATGDRPLDLVLPGKHVTPFAFTNPIWVNVGRPEEPPAHPVDRVPRRAAPSRVPEEIELLPEDGYEVAPDGGAGAETDEAPETPGTAGTEQPSGPAESPQSDAPDAAP